jgi:formylglycine-generating enzyme required for sulfatase activity/serine/threonine protein kinase
MLLPPHANPIPEKIGKYLIHGILGEGGMGIVYHGEDEKLDRKVAIKMLKKGDLANEYDKTRFLREARAMAKIRSSHVIEVYDVDEFETQPYFVMPYLQGQPLYQYLLANPSLTLKKLLELYHDFAIGVGDAHEKGILHRDLKPANLFVEAPKDRGKVLDFGLTHLQDHTHITREGTVLGTPRYMPLEQAKGEPTDATSDIFSLGVIYYEMATRTLPYPGRDSVQILFSLMHRTPVRVESLAREFPVPLADLIHRMLQREQKDRPPSMKEVLEILEAIRETRPSGSLSNPSLAVDDSVERDTLPVEASRQEQKAREETDRKEREETERHAAERRKQELSQRAREEYDRWMNSDFPRQWVEAQPGTQWDLAKLHELVEQLGQQISRRIGRSFSLKNRTDAIQAKLVQEREKLLTSRLEAQHREMQRLAALEVPLEWTGPKGGLEPTVKRVQRNWADALGVPVEYQVDLGGGVKMEFVLVPPGSFMMGGDQYDNEKPIHTVQLTKPFYIGKYPVTQQEYLQLAGKNPSHFSKEAKWQRHPVEQVNWHEAMEFAQKVQAKLKLNGFSKVTLPTEAQWEYACRAGTRTAYYFGNALNGDKANCNGNHPFGTESKGQYLQRTSLVGSYQANPFGLFDMHGNVWAWCLDGWVDKAYRGEGRMDPEIKQSNDRHCLRGGSWSDHPWSCRSAFRFKLDAGDRYSCIGFRLLLLLD